MSSLIYKKMSEVMKEVGFVAKAQTNTAQGFKFRGIDQFVNALYPALTKHGVFMAPRATQFTQEVREVTRSNGKLGVDKHIAIMMEYDFWAEDGSKVTIGPIPAEGLDSGDKATNKALSAALKYALIQTFSIPTVDMAEADLESPELGSTKPAARPTPTPTVTKGTTASGATNTGLTSGPTNVNAEFDAIPAPATQGGVTTANTVLPSGTTQTLEPLKKSTFRNKAAPKPAATATPASSTDDNGWN